MARSSAQVRTTIGSTLGFSGPKQPVYATVNGVRILVGFTKRG